MGYRFCICKILELFREYGIFFHFIYEYKNKDMDIYWFVMMFRFFRYFFNLNKKMLHSLIFYVSI